ncbi:unnamed protein product [Brachionus calyciflorus]|uniref:Chitin-binding type-2 domain-containing protein n=1 Tax=Brachionus calyciflorus TaxID=104777 RepID=A0A814M8D8_9BILA|nr:unnamed protein product [Brachionus calyciflorus]
MNSAFALLMVLIGWVHSSPINSNETEARSIHQMDDLTTFLKTYLPQSNSNSPNIDWTQLSNFFTQQQQQQQQQSQQPLIQNQQQVQLNQEPSKHLFLNQKPIRPVVQLAPAQWSLPLQVQLPFQVQAQPPIVAVIPAQKPFPIQQSTLAITGEVIIENLLGGIAFNCLGRVTGHYRDTHFCDVFHACVHGQQQKTYTCPFVGESTYFDESTRRCEFVKNNPLACHSKVFYH